MKQTEFDINSGAAVYKRLLGYVKPYRFVFALAIVGMIVMAATNAAFAALVQPLLDDIFVLKDSDKIVWLPLAIVVLYLIRGIGFFAGTYGMARVGRYVIFDLRREMFGHLLCLPNRFYDQNASGKLISKLTFDAEQVAGAATKALQIFVQDSLTLVTLLAWMFYLNWQLTLLYLVVGPFIALIVVQVNRRMRKIAKRVQNSMGDITSYAQEGIEAQREVKIFGGQAHEAGKFDQANKSNRNQNVKFAATNATSVALIQLMGAVLLAAVVYIAAQSATSVGSFASFMTAMLLMFQPIKRLTTVNAVLQKGVTAAQSIFSLMLETQERDEGGKDLKRVAGSVDFDDVRFTYDAEKGEVIKGVDLHVEAGETIAFVGRSGSGKTTLVSLLARFYNINEGSIRIDGVDIRDYSLASLRRQIALVSQHITLFNDTLANNIAYGSLDQVSREQITEAARAAHALEFIEKLPDGLDAEVGERGVTLSGGQRQRVAIARAILKDAPILILDEATSALDTESERHIQAALEDLMRGRTTFVIAHRLSTIEKADKIVVLDQGNVVEMGRHEELLVANGSYAALHRMQFSDD